jgi:hypothetical protein
MLKILLITLIIAPWPAFAGARAPVYNLNTPMGQPALQNASWAAKVLPGEDAMIKMEKSTCRSANLSQCPDFNDAQLGTLFFIAPDLALTTLHSFKDYLRARATLDGKFDNVEVPAVISRDGGKVIFGDQPGDRAYVSALYPEAKQSVMNDSLNFNYEHDLAYLRVSRPIGTVVTLGKRRATTDQRVTAVGFSESDQSGVRNFDGIVLAKPDAPLCDASPAGFAKIQYANYEPHFGLSGAPVFNANGEVIGMHIASCRSFSIFMPILEIPLEMN